MRPDEDALGFIQLPRTQQTAENARHAGRDHRRQRDQQHRDREHHRHRRQRVRADKSPEEHGVDHRQKTIDAGKKHDRQRSPDKGRGYGIRV